MACWGEACVIPFKFVLFQMNSQTEISVCHSVLCRSPFFVLPQAECDVVGICVG